MDEFKSLLNLQMVFTGQTVDPEALKELGEGIKMTDYLLRFEALFWEGGKVEGWEEA
jgi:hypothetical protein